ncbi:MAG: uroporphyrinogen-III synthase [Pseudomonadota bacterium]
MSLVLVTRPAPEAAQTVEALAARGITALAAPLTRIDYRRDVPPPPAETDALVFTSANAVEAAAAQGWPRRALPVYAVGPRTAAAARALGYDPVIEGPGDATALLPLLLATPPRRFCHPRGHHVAQDLAAPLAAAGKSLFPLTVYDAVAAPLPAEAATALDQARVSTVAVWSPRAARLFAEAAAVAPQWPLPTLTGVAISAKAAAALPEGLGAVEVAGAPTGPAMLAAIEKVGREQP